MGEDPFLVGDHIFGSTSGLWALNLCTKHELDASHMFGDMTVFLFSENF